MPCIKHQSTKVGQSDGENRAILCCVCRAVNLFDDQLDLHIWLLQLIQIDKVCYVFSKGWVVSLDYGATAIVALLSGQLQVLSFKRFKPFVEILITILYFR